MLASWSIRHPAGKAGQCRRGGRYKCCVAQPQLAGNTGISSLPAIIHFVAHLSMGTVVHKLVCVYRLLCGNGDLLAFGVGVGCLAVDNGHRVYSAAKVQRDLGECTGQTASTNPEQSAQS